MQSLCLEKYCISTANKNEILNSWIIYIELHAYELNALYPTVNIVENSYVQNMDGHLYTQPRYSYMKTIIIHVIVITCSIVMLQDAV